MVNATPVLSPTILVLTYVEGFRVGNGPSVSELVTVHASELTAFSEIVFPSVNRLSAFRITGAVATTPASPKPFFKNCFLSISIIF